MVVKEQENVLSQENEMKKIENGNETKESLKNNQEIVEIKQVPPKKKAAQNIQFELLNKLKKVEKQIQPFNTTRLVDF